MDDGRLSRRARQAMSGTVGNAYSLASVWEAAIKSALGKLELSRSGRRVPVGKFFRDLAWPPRLEQEQLRFEDAAAVEELPLLHRDPFDRLLVVQARRLQNAIVSSDEVFERYSVERV